MWDGSVRSEIKNMSKAGSGASDAQALLQRRGGEGDGAGGQGRARALSNPSQSCFWDGSAGTAHGMDRPKVSVQSLDTLPLTAGGFWPELPRTEQQEPLSVAGGGTNLRAAPPQGWQGLRVPR